MSNWKINNADVLEALRDMPDNSFDGVLCDPPYGLSEQRQQDVVDCMTAWLSGQPYQHKKSGFMGRGWDGWVPGPDVWREVLRVMKPGAYILAFAGTRTQDLMGIALRLAGFEMRDTVIWAYGSGFPKSMDVSAAIDKAAGAEREVVGTRPWSSAKMDAGNGVSGLKQSGGYSGEYNSERVCIPITAPVTEAARMWNGYGTALKPAYETCILARKPLDGTVANNCQTWGCGALWIDGGRIGTDEVITNHARGSESAKSKGRYGDSKAQETHQTEGQELGRFPANLTHDGSPEVMAVFPFTGGPGNTKEAIHGRTPENQSVYSGKRNGFIHNPNYHNDHGGSASRFFYCAKVSQAERNAGCSIFEAKQQDESRKQGNPGGDNPRNRGVHERKNHHPCCKPIALCRYLATLILPPADRPQGPRKLLVPFSGSGSEMIGALQAGWDEVSGIEREAEYAAIAEARLSHWLDAGREETKKPTQISEAKKNAATAKRGAEKSNAEQLSLLKAVNL